jgi:hypothetical protein
MPPKKDPKIAERIAKLEDGIGALQLLDATGTRWADPDPDWDTTDSDSSVRTLPNRFAVSAIKYASRGGSCVYSGRGRCSNSRVLAVCKRFIENGNTGESR